MNEPVYRPTPAEAAELKAHKPDDDFTRELQHRHELQYVRVARAAIDGIRAHDPDRLIVTDGYPGRGLSHPGAFRYPSDTELPYLHSRGIDPLSMRVGTKLRTQ